MKNIKRILSIILVLALVFGSVNLPVRATEDGGDSGYSGDASSVMEENEDTFTVNYDATYLKTPIASRTLTMEDDIYFPDSTYYVDRTGYYVQWIRLWVNGWGYGRVPGSSVAASEFDELTVGATATIKPGYKALDYQIEYVLESVDASGKPIVDETEPAVNHEGNQATYTIEDDITFYTPTKTGYTFEGWYLDSKYQQTVSGFSKGTYGNKTLYAKWRENKYTIQFDGNGGTPEKQSITVGYTENAVLPSATASQEGYRIRNWGLNGTDNIYGVGEVVNRLSTEDGATVTMVANYYNNFGYVDYVLEPLDETGNPVSDDENPAKNHGDNIYSYTYGETFTFKDPVKTGYTFGGWYADKEYTEQVTEIQATDTEDFTLYAKWTENEYTVQFHGNDGANTVTSKTLKYTEVFEIPDEEDFSKKGYRLVHWKDVNSYENGTVYHLQDKISKLTDENGSVIDFYAMWLEEVSEPVSSYNLL